MDVPITIFSRIEAVIEELTECASSCPCASLEQDALFAEIAALRAMLGAVRTMPVSERKHWNSPLLMVAMQENLAIPETIIKHVGEIREAFRRLSPKPCPYCGFPLRSEKAKQCFQCGADWH